MNIFGYPAHCGFYELDRLSKEVDATLKTKEVFMGGHIGKYAAKIHNEQELELIKNYWKAAFSSCESIVTIENDDFRGPDWYFIFIKHEYAYETICTLKTLTERKREFENFVREYD
jgi:hypothetical protein